MSATDVGLVTAAQIATEIILIPHYEQHRTLGERVRPHDCWHDLCQEYVAIRQYRCVVAVAAGRAVLVIALVGHDVDEARCGG